MDSSAKSASAELDAADPLRCFRSRFAGPEAGVVAYLDGNSLGRPVLGTDQRLAGFVTGDWGRGLIRSWDQGWMEEPIKLGDLIGRVALGAGPGQVVVGDSTSVLLYKLVRAAVAARPGRPELVIDQANFPTDRYLLQGIAEECDLHIRWLNPTPAGGVEPDQLAAVLGEQTAVVVLSQVAYRSGFLADLPAITALAHEAGALVVWDLCHSVGAVPIDLDAAGVDLAVGCTYKYLNGGPGSPAFCYVRAGLQDHLEQPIWGWMGAAEPFSMGPDYRPASGMRRFLTGTPPILAMQPIRLMLELIDKAGLPAIRQKSVQLTEFAVALFDRHLVDLGVQLASPRKPGRRGSHITIDHPDFQSICATLWRQGVIPDFRHPNGIRLGLSPLSTSYAEVELGIQAIRDLLLAGRDQ